MTSSNDPLAIIDRIATGQATEADLDVIRRLLLGNETQSILQVGKYNINLGQAHGDIHIGDRIYQGADANAIREILRSLLQEISHTESQGNIPKNISVDELVKQLRSRLYDDIQCLHGMMPLWGIDHWVPLSELFVDVNVLEKLSSSNRSELDDLWQDFNTNPSYRSLNRIGLGQAQKRISGLDVLIKNTNLMVVGKPGSGKTTYLQRIITECNTGTLQAHRIPALIKLREFIDDGHEVAYSIKDFLEQYWQVSNIEILEILTQGRVLLMLDGLDEITGKDGKTIIKRIQQFARNYPQVQIIVTCRTQSQNLRFSRFDYIEVADFNESQVRTFAEHWFKSLTGNEEVGLAKAVDFLEQLSYEENEAIRELAITPILLSLTCAVFHYMGKLYSKRSKLYQEGLEILLERWDESRGIERDGIYRDLSVEKKLELLSYLAVKKFKESQYVLFEQVEIEEYISEFLKIERQSSRLVLRTISEQHGLLIERSQKVWSFSHLTFQEYLVARYFCDRKHWDFLVAQFSVTHWNEVFLLISDMVINVDIFFQLIENKINNMLVDDIEIQNYLTWLNEKSNSLRLSSYTPAALRALYMSLAFDNPEEDFELSSILGINLNFDFLPIDPSGEERLICEYAVDSNLRLVLSYASDNSPISKHLRSPIPIILNQIIENELQDILFEKRSLERELQLLIQGLPTWWVKQSFIDIDKIDRWWQLHGEAWTKELRKVTIKYRNFGHDWHFNEYQKEKLEKYYAANKLLVYCLHAFSSCDEEFKERIKENLLLPNCKNEKYKCNNP